MSKRNHAAEQAEKHRRNGQNKPVPDPRDGADRKTIEEPSPNSYGAVDPWEAPVPFPDDVALPAFPTNRLPPWMADFVAAEAIATQTPPDLAAMLILGVGGAALAKKLKVVIRDSWAEPLNIFVACALFTGERKSAVFADVLRPVQDFETQEIERMAPIIAELASEHRMLEAKLKHAEGQAAKEPDKEEARLLRHEATQIAKELVAHVVPAVPQLTVDDCTPEALVKTMAAQGGRILQAAAEGTLFEIAKGRYSETANFDVYLKGHAGDPLRVGRVSRDGEILPEAVLSVAVAIQPDVIQGLAENPTMRARGFLGRFLYSLPASRVGNRAIASSPVSAKIADNYHQTMLDLWRTEGIVDERGKPEPIFLHFSKQADLALQDFERWLEPQLAPDGQLGNLAGWANKLAGAVARLAGILHVAFAAECVQSFNAPIQVDVVENAIVLGRDYLLAHAQAAFALMAANPDLEDAKRVLAFLRRELNELNEKMKGLAFFITKAKIHQNVFGGSRDVDEIEKITDLLQKHGYLRPVREEKHDGRGRKPGLRFEVNPVIQND